ncbi:MAG TPA: DUF5615 family PIN-like protein [Chloroflexota bacterium]
MKVLLDKDMPRQLKRELAGHDISTVREMGWNGIKNGALLGLAVSAGFEVFLTIDRSIPYQQNVPALRIAVVILALRNNRLATIRAMTSDILAALEGSLQPGTVTIIGDWRIG